MIKIRQLGYVHVFQRGSLVCGHDILVSAGRDWILDQRSEGCKRLGGERFNDYSARGGFEGRWHLRIEVNWDEDEDGEGWKVGS